jgi:hypothetical protein
MKGGCRSTFRSTSLPRMLMLRMTAAAAINDFWISLASAFGAQALARLTDLRKHRADLGRSWQNRRMSYRGREVSRAQGGRNNDE